VADPHPSPWTRICVRQADVILLVGAAGAAGQLTPGLLDILGTRDPLTGARRELVLVYDRAREQPHGTAEWMARLPVGAHHHLDPRCPGDFERLARMLTGRALGLVLGGGGARGLAHIGILRALEEARIPVDLAGGTSIGAFISAQRSLGWESARIREETRRVLVDGGSLNDFTLPVMALLYGRRFAEMFQRFFGDRQIEDLPHSYFAIATNLTQSSVHVHRRSFLWKAVASSMSVPGLGPPIFEGRDLLVDGGIVNNLPVDVMRSFDRGPVFASSVSPRVEMRLDKDYAQPLSPWRVLFSWISPFGTPIQVPSIMSVLARTASLQLISSAARGFADADLVFEPPNAGFKLLEWNAIDRIVESGYRCAVPIIEKWQAAQS
jgi:predicted acylesterase/phospholipase RssA